MTFILIVKLPIRHNYLLENPASLARFWPPACLHAGSAPNALNQNQAPVTRLSAPPTARKYNYVADSRSHLLIDWELTLEAIIPDLLTRHINKYINNYITYNRLVTPCYIGKQYNSMGIEGSFIWCPWEEIHYRGVLLRYCIWAALTFIVVSVCARAPPQYKDSFPNMVIPVVKVKAVVCFNCLFVHSFLSYYGWRHVHIKTSHFACHLTVC